MGYAAVRALTFAVPITGKRGELPSIDRKRKRRKREGTSAVDSRLPPLARHPVECRSIGEPRPCRHQATSPHTLSRARQLERTRSAVALPAAGRGGLHGDALLLPHATTREHEAPDRVAAPEHERSKNPHCRRCKRLMHFPYAALDALGTCPFPALARVLRKVVTTIHYG
jgi:hypothetical protein